MAYLARCQVADPRVGTVDGSLLHDPVARRLPVTCVFGAHTVLPIKHTPRIQFNYLLLPNQQK